MRKPKIVLKKVKYHQGHEGDGVNCDVWLDGVNCLHVLDDGNGGGLNITDNAYGSKRPELIKNLVKELNNFVNSLPEQTLDFGTGNCIKDKQGKDKLFKITLEDYINDMLIEHQKAKEMKKMQKLMLTSFVIGVPNGASYSYINYKKPLSSMPKVWLQGRLENIIKMHCAGEAEILNTNLKELGLKI